MNEDVWKQIVNDIESQNIRFGSCEVRLTFHDGRLGFYELTTRFRRNADAFRGKYSREKEADTMPDHP